MQVKQSHVAVIKN